MAQVKIWGLLNSWSWSVPTSPKWEAQDGCLVYVIQPFTLIALYHAQNVAGTHWISRREGRDGKECRQAVKKVTSICRMNHESTVIYPLKISPVEFIFLLLILWQVSFIPFNCDLVFSIILPVNTQRSSLLWVRLWCCRAPTMVSQGGRLGITRSVGVWMSFVGKTLTILVTWGWKLSGTAQLFCFDPWKLWVFFVIWTAHE